MFDEPTEGRGESALNPKQRAQEKADELRIHAEVCAVFEGPRKFDAEIDLKLSDAVARDIQKRIAKLEKSKEQASPILPAESAEEARALLAMAKTDGLATNDYHILRRPGELMIVRWLEGEQVESFYERMQAHFDVALEGEKEDERDERGWKQEEKTAGYLEALEGLDVKMAERYLREIIRKHNVFVLSTLTADQMDILHICDTVMGVAAAKVVGKASAPGDEASESDRAWFFKLLSLRGMVQGVERMCFFTYMQKAEESW